MLLAALAASIGGLMVLYAERGTPMRVDARFASLALREAIAMVGVWVLRPFGWAERPPAIVAVPEAGPRRVPVLLVAAPNANRASLFFLATFLKARGFAWVWPVSLAGRDRPLPEHAAVVARAIATLAAASGAPKVDVIAHDAGALAAAWSARHLTSAGSMRKLVAIGAPWRGTRAAVFRRGVYAEDLLYESALLDGLLPCGVPVISVFSPDDAAVIPTRSAAPEVAQLEPVAIDGAGHWEMLFSARIYRAVFAALELPIAEPPPESRATSASPEAR